LCDRAPDKQKRRESAADKPDVNRVRGNPALLLRKNRKRFAFRSDQGQKQKALLHAVLDRFHKRRLARGSQKILQWCEWQADKD